MYQSSRKTKKSSSISAASPDPVFSAGDQALLLYEHKGRTYNVPVVVERAVWAVDESFTLVRPRAPRTDMVYVVKSELGGTMTVRAQDLRPGTVLDRIVAAIESDGPAPSSD